MARGRQARRAICRCTLLGTPGFTVLAVATPAGSGIEAAPRSFQARLKEGVSLRDADAQLNVIARRLAAADPAAYPKPFRLDVVNVIDQVVGDFRGVLYTALGAVALLLVMACCNVASMLLAKAASRAREMTIRAALGAGRNRIVRQVLVGVCCSDDRRRGSRAAGLPWHRRARAVSSSGSAARRGRVRSGSRAAGVQRGRGRIGGAALRHRAGRAQRSPRSRRGDEERRERAHRHARTPASRRDRSGKP